MNNPQRVQVEQAEQHDGPSLFTGIQLEVDEILLCGSKTNAACNALAIAVSSRHEAAVKQAADDIAKIASQQYTLAAHLASVISRHMNRNPRA